MTERMEGVVTVRDGSRWSELPLPPDFVSAIDIQGTRCVAVARSGYGRMLVEGCKSVIENGSTAIEFASTEGGAVSAVDVCRAVLPASNGQPTNVVVIAYAGGPTGGGIHVSCLHPLRSTASIPLPFTPTRLLQVNNSVVIFGDTLPRVLHTTDGAVSPLAPLHSESLRVKIIDGVRATESDQFVTLDAEGVLRKWTLPAGRGGEDGKITCEACVVSVPAEFLEAIYPAQIRLRGTSAVWVLYRKTSAYHLALLSVKPLGEEVPCEVLYTHAFAQDGVRKEDIRFVKSCREVDLVSVCSAPAAGLELCVFAVRGGVVGRIPVELPPLFATTDHSDELLGCIGIPMKTGAVLDCIKFVTNRETIDVELMSPCGMLLRQLGGLNKVLSADRAAAVQMVTEKNIFTYDRSATASMAESTQQIIFLLDFFLESGAIQMACKWIRSSNTTQTEDVGVLKGVLLWVKNKIFCCKQDLTTAMRVLNRGQWSKTDDRSLDKARKEILQLSALSLVLGDVQTDSTSDWHALQAHQEQLQRSIETECLQDQLDAIIFLKNAMFRRTTTDFEPIPTIIQNLQNLGNSIKQKRQKFASSLRTAADEHFSNTSFIMNTLLQRVRQRCGCSSPTFNTLARGWQAISQSIDQGVSPGACPPGLAAKIDMMSDASGEGVALAFDVLFSHGQLDDREAQFLSDDLQLLDLPSLFSDVKAPKLTKGCKVDLLRPVGAGWTAGIVSFVNSDNTVDITTADGSVFENIPDYVVRRQGASIVLQPCALKLFRQSVFYLYLLGSGGFTEARTSNSVAQRYAKTVAKIPPRWLSFLGSVFAAELKEVVYCESGVKNNAEFPLNTLDASEVNGVVMSMLFPLEGDVRDQSRLVTEGAELSIRCAVDDVCFAAFRSLFAKHSKTPPDVFVQIISTGLLPQLRPPKRTTLDHSLPEMGDIQATASANSENNTDPSTTVLETPSLAVFRNSGVSFALLVYASNLVKSNDYPALFELQRRLGLVGDEVSAFSCVLLCMILQEQADWKALVTEPLGAMEEECLVYLLHTIKELQGQDMSTLQAGTAHADVNKLIVALLHTSCRYEELFKFCMNSVDQGHGGPELEKLLTHLQHTMPDQLISDTMSNLSEHSGTLKSGLIPKLPLHHNVEASTDPTTTGLGQSFMGDSLWQ